MTNAKTEYYDLTMYRTSATRASLSTASWQVNTGIPACVKKPEWVSWKCKALASVEPLDVSVAARYWEGGLCLEKLVEDVAVAAGMMRCFKEENRKGNTIG